MLRLSGVEKKVLAELESGTLPEVAAIRLGMEPRTLDNYIVRMRGKCTSAGDFLKEMKAHQKVLKLRITVKIESEPKRKV